MRRALIILGLAFFPLVLARPATPQHHGSPHSMAPMAPESAGEPIRITPEALHAAGGVPPGWRFAIPPGDAKKGREIFAKLECFKCHEVEGEGFPGAGRGQQDVGPALTGMGPLHPAEYFAESIISPNRVILEGPGFSGPDGRSTMPSYNEVLTVQELIDLVAYLESLTGGGHGGMEGH